MKLLLKQISDHFGKPEDYFKKVKPDSWIIVIPESKIQRKKNLLQTIFLSQGI